MHTGVTAMETDSVVRALSVVTTATLVCTVIIAIVFAALSVYMYETLMLLPPLSRHCYNTVPTTDVTPLAITTVVHTNVIRIKNQYSRHFKFP